MVLDQYAGRHFNLLERVLTEGRVVCWYVSILLLPLPSRMNLEHDFAVSQSLFSPPTTFLAFLALLALLLWPGGRAVAPRCSVSGYSGFS
jgi:protein O-mannosyl-transferase